MTMWVEMKKHFAARSSEWLNGFLLSAWGAYLLLNPGMFDQDSLRGLRSLTSQENWGFGAFLCGNIRVVALFINGQWGITPLIRVATSFISVFMWFWICVGIYLSGVPQVTLVIYAGLLLADVFSAFRAASDAYEAEANRRLAEMSESTNVSSFRRS